MVEPVAYSINDAAAASGLGRTTVYGLLKAGMLKRVKIGARTVILRSDLEQFLNRAASA